jgi:hypothetical protein
MKKRMKEGILRKDDHAKNGDSSFRLLCNAVSTDDATGVKAREEEEIKKKSGKEDGRNDDSKSRLFSNSISTAEVYMLN